MAKGKRKKAASKQHAMDQDDQPASGGWQSGVSAETGEDFIGMDTTDFGGKAKGAGTAPGLKVKQGKRGNRTRAQKRRKGDKLEKALAFAAKVESKAGRVSATKALRKNAKGLWSKDDGEGGGPAAALR